MSLKNRIQQIALETVKGYVSTLTDITQNNTQQNNSGAVQIGVIQSISDNTYTIQFADGTNTTVAPGGLRQVGPGDCVLIANGAIIG